ncbi:hypothetical protein CY34DRAFT_95365, partial [Suillus luteus UH-Slu-Lm8-n1]
LIEDGKLWCLREDMTTHTQSRVECINKDASKEHEEGEHWGRDTIRIILLNRIYRPGLDMSIMTAIAECTKYKNFGNICTHYSNQLHADIHLNCE